MDIMKKLMHPNYESISFACGTGNPSGLKTKVLFAPMSVLTAVAEVPASPASLAAECVITGDHTFGVSDGFVEIYATEDSLEVTHDLVGEKDGKGYMNKLEFHHPGQGTKIAGFLTAYSNCPGIYLVEKPDGTVLQIGYNGRGARIESSGGTTGKAPEDRAGNTITIQGYSKFAYIIYEGTITMKP